jgi:hypothetical protein
MTLPLSSEVNRILFDKQQKNPKHFQARSKCIVTKVIGVHIRNTLSFKIITLIIIYVGAR